MCAQGQDAAVGVVRRLMSGYTKAARQRRLTVMLQCYADDSGSDVQPGRVFLLAGYVMHHPRWEDFAEKWDVQLKRGYPIEYCRMSDAEAGSGEFAGMDSVFRKRKVKDLAEVVFECMPTAFACLMEWDDYRSRVKGKVDSRLDNPYAILFFKVMAMISQFQIWSNQVANFGYSPVDFIFDDQGQAGLKSLQWYAGLRERVQEPHRTMISNTPQFKNDRDLNPLQAADMLAWHVRRGREYPEEDRSDVCHLLGPEGLWAYRIKPQELDGIVTAWTLD